MTKKEIAKALRMCSCTDIDRPPCEECPMWLHNKKYFKDQNINVGFDIAGELCSDILLRMAAEILEKEDL